MKHEYQSAINIDNVINLNDCHHYPYYIRPNSSSDKTQTTSPNSLGDFVREANKNTFSPSTMWDLHSITTDANTIAPNIDNFVRLPRKSIKHTLPMNIINILND